MDQQSSEDTAKKSFKQKLGLLVRARLLFKREIEIDASRGGVFDRDYLARLISISKQIDLEMSRMLSFSAGATFILYLVGVGSKTPLAIWGLNLHQVPGIAIFLSLFAAFSLALSAFAFLNSQSYAALIDEVILNMADGGIVDTDAIKASYAREWLVLKVLRKDFSFYFSVHISMGRTGRVFSAVMMFLAVSLVLLPFTSLVCALPYLAITTLPEGLTALLAQCITVASALFVVLSMLTLLIGFECDVELEDPNETQEQDIA